MSHMKPKSLKNAYVALPVIDKLVALVGFALLALVMAWRFEWNIPVSVGVVVGFALVTHIMLRYTSLAANLVVIALQAIFLPAAATGYSLVSGGTTVVTYLSNMVLLLGGSLVAFIIASRLPRGRLWFNALVAFALIDVGGLVVIALISTRAGAAIGVALAWVYLFLRFLPWHRWLRKVDEIQTSSLPLLADKQWDKHLADEDWKVYESSLIPAPLQRLVVSHHGVYALSGFKPSAGLKLENGRLRYKGRYLEEHFAQMLEEAENLSFVVKVPHSSIDVVLLVDSSHLPTGTQRFFVDVQGMSRAKAISGRVLVCTPKGLKQHDSSRKSDPVKLSDKQCERIQKILA